MGVTATWVGCHKDSAELAENFTAHIQVTGKLIHRTCTVMVRNKNITFTSVLALTPLV